MTWGEIQIESLKKMFLNNDDLTINELENYKTNKKYKTYLFAMPQACNEAINYIASLLGTIEGIKKLEKSDESDFYNLSGLIDDYKKIKKVICQTGIKWEMINDSIIKIENWNSGDVNIVYEQKPIVIMADSDIYTKINLNNEYANLIPLYIAGELYKDDDISLATVYMNEFMTLINNFVSNNITVVNPSIETIYSIE